MWKYDYERKTEIEKQLIKGLIESFQNELNIGEGEAEILAKDILTNYIEVVPPMYYETPPRMDMITFPLNGPISGRGVSRKPSNITYNINNLINASTDSGLAIASALGGMSWVIPIAVARVFYNLSQAIKIELTELEGFIVETIHRYRTEGKNDVDYNILFRQVNIQLENKIDRTISKTEFDRALDNLSEIMVIEYNQNVVTLLEGIKYSAI